MKTAIAKKTNANNRKRYSNENYSKQLNKILDDVFEIAWRRDWSWADLSRFSEVGFGTIVRIGQRESKLPQFRTVEKLCKSVGLNINTNQGKITVS